MGKRYWKRQLRRLERAGNDDFLLILTGGAGAYPTYELHHLLRRIRLQAKKLQRLRSWLFRIGASIPTLMLLACAFGVAGILTATYVCLFVLPLCLAGLVFGTYYVTGNFSCMDRAKRLRGIIQQELERRRKDVAA